MIYPKTVPGMPQIVKVDHEKPAVNQIPDYQGEIGFADGRRFY
jgi:hypothetical protein